MKINSMEDLQGVFAKAKSVALYGAGSVGKLVLETAVKSGWRRKIKIAYVTEIKDDTPTEIVGVPVVQFDSSEELECDVVMVSVMERNQEDIKLLLERLEGVYEISDELIGMLRFFQSVGGVYRMVCEVLRNALKRKFPISNWLFPCIYVNIAT